MKKLKALVTAEVIKDKLEILSDKLEYIVKMVDKEKDLKKKKSVALKLLLELWSQEPVLKQR